MQVAQQLAVFLANEPGTLASLCEMLAKEKINIIAVATSDTVDHQVVRLVLSEPRRALSLLEKHGILVVENDVLMIEGSNKPGNLAHIARILSDARVNIEYAYCATPPAAQHGVLILRPSHVPKALKALNQAGIA